MSYTHIEEAFAASFNGGGFGLVAIRENESPPSNGSSYAQLLTALVDKKPFTLCGTDQIDGVFRVILHYPQGNKSEEAREKAAQIESHYKIGSCVLFGYDEPT